MSSGKENLFLVNQENRRHMLGIEKTAIFLDVIKNTGVERIVGVSLHHENYFSAAVPLERRD